MEVEDLKKKIEKAIPGARVEIKDPRHDGVHLKAIVISERFKGKTLLEQHRMVLNALKGDFKTDILHALGLETKTE
ncbi:MAG: BolA/IbaG family iron-sulfur metabolism protein [Nanoarchaeota archaeon]